MGKIQALTVAVICLPETGLEASVQGKLPTVTSTVSYESGGGAGHYIYAPS